MKKYSCIDIEKIKSLRRKGLSIGKIVHILHLPKTTVWNYIQDVHLSPEKELLLRLSQGGSKKRKEEYIRQAKEQAILLLKGKDRESIIILAMLYWAEGHKKNSCGFTNTDGKMISIYLYIIRTVLKIPESRIHVTVRIFSGMKRQECLKHWSSVAHKPIADIKLRINDGGTSGKKKYGICRIEILKGHKTLKLMHALVDNIIATY